MDRFKYLLTKLMVIALSICGLVLSSNSASAADLSSCIGGTGSGVLTSYSLVLSVNIHFTCTIPDTKNPKVPADYFSVFSTFPTYEVVEDSFFVNSVTGKCSGPSFFNQVIQSGNSIGTITCTIPFSITSRYGAITSTIKMSSSFSNSVFFSIQHGAIPKQPQSGSVGGSSTTSAAPVTKSCVNPPNNPNLTISHPDRNAGPLFHFSAATNGEVTTGLAYSYALFDSVSKAWDTWTEWKTVTSSSAIMGTDYQAQIQDGKTKIAFGVYAFNVCGNSAQTRESDSHLGVVLITENSLISMLDAYQKNFDSVSSSFDQVLAIGEGNASLMNAKSTKPMPPAITDNPDVDSQNILKFENDALAWVNSTQAIVTQWQADKAAADKAAADKAAADKAAADKAAADKAAANSKNSKATVRSINCYKGKVVKRIIGSNPICPIGYKLKA